MGGTNQFDTNTCHLNKKLDHILKHLHLFRNFPKSPIIKYSDCMVLILYSFVRTWQQCSFRNPVFQVVTTTKPDISYVEGPAISGSLYQCPGRTGG